MFSRRLLLQPTTILDISEYRTFSEKRSCVVTTPSLGGLAYNATRQARGVVGGISVVAVGTDRLCETVMRLWGQIHNQCDPILDFQRWAKSAILGCARRLSPGFQRLISVTLESLKSLWISHYESLYWYAMRILGDRHEAEDVMQDTVLSLLQRHQGLEISDDTEFVAYCRVSLKHRCLDRFRIRRPLLLGDDLDVVTIAPQSADNLVATEMANQVVHTINQLPPHQREVITRYMAGESTESIAAALSVKESTVRSLRRHAIRFLSERLQEVSK